jgi:hypothetical protein
MKAYTDDAGYGALQRLQLVWATLDCASSPAKAPQPVDAPAAVEKLETAAQTGPAAAAAPPMVESVEAVQAIVVSGQGAVTEVVTEVNAAGAAEAVAAPEPTSAPVPEPTAAAEPEVTPVEASVATPAAAEATPTPAAAEATPATATVKEGACSPGAACKDGVCATSSCAVNGMGKDVLTMMCFGTNIVPNPILDATTGNPCTNLACKLDRPNCTSVGLLGVGGFCTGEAAQLTAAAAAMREW